MPDESVTSAVLCDALSVGIAFASGTRAVWGGVAPAFPTPTPCADAGMD